MRPPPPPPPPPLPVADLFDVVPHRVALGQAREQHLAVAHDDGQDIVEVVRDTAGQSPHGLHLLRVPQLLFRLVESFFCFHTFGDVVDDHKASAASLEDEIVGLELDEGEGAVLEAMAPTLFLQSLEAVGHALGQRRKVLGGRRSAMVKAPNSWRLYP